MLAKAILTGGILSVLAGSVVYFGTEGADATTSKITTTSVTETVTATTTIKDDVLEGGVAEVETKTALAVEADPDKPKAKTDKPKTKWLDQYLKREKSSKKPKSDIVSEEVEDTVETMMERTDVDTPDDDDTSAILMPNDEKANRKGARDDAKGSYIVSQDKRDSRDDSKGDRRIERKIITEKMHNKKTKSKTHTRVKTSDNAERMAATMDYDRVVAEAEKLLVVDMRDSALLEIVDFAIDQRDMDKAADVLSDLSTPELRDTARARMGKAFGHRGETDAAFAVLDTVEIDELVAPIRLEIISAMMATHAERVTAAKDHRHEPN